MTQSMPPEIPRTHSKFGRALGRITLKALGWKIKGTFPKQAKFVAAVAPHTSNWDFIVAIAVKLKLGVRIQFLGKHTIFFWPLGVLLKRLGGIPVDRRAAHGVVDQVKREFEIHPQLILGIAPEGTRHKRAKWKTGFLHIAHRAQVPIIPMALDYRTKHFVIMPPIDIHQVDDATLQRVISVYDKEMAKFPANMSGVDD